MRDGELGVGEPVEVVDAVLAEVIVADVRDDGDVRTVERRGRVAGCPPRAVSRTAASTARIAQHARVPGGARIVARLDRVSFATNTPSVQQNPSRQPCARAQAATSRTVVVLPFEPVTTAIGTSRNARPRHVLGSQAAPSSGQRRLPLPAPSVSCVSSTMHSSAARLRPRRTSAIRSRATLSRPRAARNVPARHDSSSTGASTVGGIRRLLRRAAATQRLLDDRRQRSGRAPASARAKRPLVDLGRGEQLVGRRGECERRATGVATRDARPARVRPPQMRRAPARRAHATRPATPRRTSTRAVSSTAPVRGEEQVAAGQATRIVEGQGGRRVQSSVSGARRTPRSSRIRPLSSLTPRRRTAARSVRTRASAACARPRPARRAE